MKKVTILNKDGTTKRITLKAFMKIDKAVEKMKYRVLSPDGFDIEANGGYRTKAEAKRAFETWRDGYKAQGYYSTIYKGERIKLSLKDLAEDCEFITI